MRSLIQLFAIAMLAFSPGLPAQEACSAGQQAVPYFGWYVTACTDCSMRGYYTEYLRPPRISSIRADGPAAGRLQENDLLLAVDGLSIITPEAWHRLRDAKSGDALRFTVSNEGTTRDETIRVASRCLPLPAPAHPRIIMMRRRRGSI
ncbi:MAG TPA: PDZ domain-containing protein [Candidatus Angelobacter sp.]